MARSRRSRRINPRSDSQRASLRMIGGVMCAIGAVFAIIGFGSFFSAFGGHGSPDKFWCIFVGMPLVGIGSQMLKFGYLGAVARYAAGEVAPVATDTLNFAADETRGSVRKMSGAIAAGLRDAGYGNSGRSVNTSLLHQLQTRQRRRRALL